MLPGYTGGKQQRCVICNEHVSWACATCSTPLNGIVPVHPPPTGVGKNMVRFCCYAAHCRQPHLAPKGKAAAHNPNSGKKQTRKKVTTPYSI